MSGSFFKGTSLAQDPRFGDVTQKLASETTFNKILKKRVDMSKVNTEAIKPWLSYKINNVLGIDDEVLFEYILNMLEESDTPDGKAMQVNLTGFMESKAGEFMQDLWTVLLEAQKGPGGIPESFIRGKVEEIKKERVEQVRMKEAIKTADARARDGASKTKIKVATEAGTETRIEIDTESVTEAAIETMTEAAIETVAETETMTEAVTETIAAKDTDQQAFQSFENCTRSAEQSTIDRLTGTSSTKPVVRKADVEFGLAIANHCNHLFSKRSGELHKLAETKDRPAPCELLEGAERMLRVAVCAFRFLHSNRSMAGFSVLALEKTMSNFATACANAHLGVRAWDGLVLLRQCLLEYAETHTVVAANGMKAEAVGTQAGSRAVRKPATKLVKGANVRTASGSERLTAGMRRLSIVRTTGTDSSAESLLSSMAHFPISHNRGDTSFNVLVVTLLCNVLRILSQAPTAPQATELMSRLGMRTHSALEWCLRLRDADSAAADPFLGACFRAYYALGSVGGPASLDIRVLGLVAYANTKTCDMRELLKYAVRAAARAESVATADDPDMHRPIAAYYAAVADLAKPLVMGTTIAPETVDFYHRWSVARRSSGDLLGALEVCSQVAARNGGDSHSELVACALACNCLVHYMLSSGEQHDDVVPAGERMAELAELALGRSARHTLSGWNALAMCADISRKTAKRAVAELREASRLEVVQSSVAGAMVFMLDATDRIYEAYISRGAALKAQEANGSSSSVAALRSCCAEVCVLAVQLAVQYQSHDAVAVARHSDRLLQLCKEEGAGGSGSSSTDFLRSHSTVLFNSGATLYQLKSYLPAALAMERAIASLSLWVTLTADVSSDVFMQLCKRYEIAALAFQAGGSYLRASQAFGRAVAWIGSQDAVLNAISAGSAVLPTNSSFAVSCGEVERLLMFVDRYVRMCAARLARDPSESQAHVSLLDHIPQGVSISSSVVRAWISEAEAFLWRPFATAPSAPSALDVSAARLCCALELYTSEKCDVDRARCLVELAKIDRDRGSASQCIDRLREAAAAVAPESSCVYALGVAAKSHAWLTIVFIELDQPHSEHLSQCAQLWERMWQVAAAGANQQLDAGYLLGAVAAAMNQTSDLLMSRRMYSAALGVLRSKLGIADLCEAHSQPLCAPIAMQALLDLGTASLLLGQTTVAAEFFRQAAERYEDGVLPAPVEIASKVAYASFCLACGDEAAGSSAMRDAGVLARSVLDAGSSATKQRSKRPAVSPETMLLYSRAAQAHSMLSLRQGALADAVDYGLHSYRILHSLLRSLATAHARAKQEALENRLDSVAIVDNSDDPFAAQETKEAAVNKSSAEDNNDDDYCQFVAFSGNWELQRLLIDNLAHLTEVYSLRGSVKEAEYFLRKGLAISAELHAPRQEAHLRLREADILARKNMWDECAELLLTKVRPLQNQQLLPEAVDGVELETIRALVVEGDSWRRASKYQEAASAYARAQEMLGCIATNDDDDVLLLPLLQVVAEDLAVRQRLLAVLTGNDPLLMDSVVAPRCIDQRPEHLLMQANVAFSELQRLLASSEPAWSSVLQSALVFPALRRSCKQPLLRKNSVKAVVRGRLAELDALLVAAAESAITVGSAHCVHESCHLLALTRAMSLVFGFEPATTESSSSGVLASIVDDARNITAVREAVDVIRRRRNATPASLTRWPSDALEAAAAADSPLSSSPSLMPRRGLRQPGRSSPPSFQLPRALLLDGYADHGPKAEVEEGKNGVDYFGYAVDGAKVVAGWSKTASKDGDRQLLRDCLPSTWVACSISIDALRNVLFVTR
ncbi:Serine/arginine repetitive matrix protein 1, partial [Coemansia aciculifera]